MKNKKLVLFLLFIIYISKLNAQYEEYPFRIFGYFQVSFIQQLYKNESDKKSFSLQQMNLFLQHDLSENWSAFAGLEFINNYNSGKSWGDFSLSEVWVKYYASKRLNIKLGLQIPAFNHLNEISNKTPLLPYIVRPLAYESSFAEFMNLDDFIPRRAFAQIYGFLPVEETKIDYSFYVGNSPNISTKATKAGQSGTDTSNIFMVGGRIGLRYEDVKIGFSATYDEINKITTFEPHSELVINNNYLEHIPRFRIGNDIMMDFKKFSFNAEYIKVLYDTGDKANLDKQFFYATIGYRVTDDLLTYFSLFSTEENYNLNINELKHLSTAVSVTIPNVGFSYDINDRIKLKGQFARVDIDIENSPTQNVLTFYYAAAISVFF
jgi:hypothetical protein